MTELFLVARIAGQAVAIRSDQVDSVVDIAEVTAVPRAVRHVAGLAALRSRVVTVVDTPAMLAGTAAPLASRRAVITLVDGYHYALLVDALDDVIALAALPLAAGVALDGDWAPLVDGMVERDGTPIPIINLPAVVAGISTTQAA